MAEALEYRENLFKKYVPKAGSFDGTWSIYSHGTTVAIGEAVIKTDKKVLSVNVDWKDPNWEDVKLERRWSIAKNFNMWLHSDKGKESVVFTPFPNQEVWFIVAEEEPGRNNPACFAMGLTRDMETGIGVQIEYMPMTVTDDNIRRDKDVFIKSIPLPETTRLHLKRNKDDKAKAPEQSGAKADQEAE